MKRWDKILIGLGRRLEVKKWGQREQITQRILYKGDHRDGVIAGKDGIEGKGVC